MSKSSIINVLGHAISISVINDLDFISLTDMVYNNGGNDKIQQWIRNKDTIEALGLWEQMYNPNFNSVEFHRIMFEAGVSRFTLSISQWIAKTNAIGIKSVAGRNGSTKAHKDIAFLFGSYLSPAFHWALIKEFQRLKDEESKRLGGHWDFRRFTAKVNLKIQTDAIKTIIIPQTSLPIDKQGILYAEGSDIIYMAMFGYTSKQWRDNNPELAKKGWNIRDVADTHQLIVLANLENIDALLIKNGITDKYTRIKELRKEAISQVKLLRTSTELQHQLIESPNLAEHKRLSETDTAPKQTPSLKEPLSQFNNDLKTALNYNPKDDKYKD